jgi:hypothetical protein
LPLTVSGGRFVCLDPMREPMLFSLANDLGEISSPLATALEVGCNWRDAEQVRIGEAANVQWLATDPYPEMRTPAFRESLRPRNQRLVIHAGIRFANAEHHTLPAASFPAH